MKINGLQDRVSEELQNVANLRVEVVGLKNYAAQVEASSKVVRTIVKDKEVVIEKKVAEIQEVYVPQIQYVKEYVRVKDETDCEASSKLFNSIVY